MGYREMLEGEPLLQLLPFEHVFRYVSHASVINRLTTERNLFDCGLMDRDDEDRPFVTLLVLLQSESGMESMREDLLQVTVFTWMLQSCPWTNCAILAFDRSGYDRFSAWRNRYASLEKLRLLRKEDFNFGQSWIGKYVVFGKPGDIFHPALATALTLRAKESQGEFLTWYTQYYCETANKTFEIERFVRSPNREVFTTWHVNHIGTSFAVCQDLAKQYPGDLLEEVVYADGHPFHVWVASQSQLRYVSHPEYLSMRPESAPLQASSWSFNKFRRSYGLAMQALGDDLMLKEIKGHTPPFRLVPRKRAESVAVVIPFRDKADVTCRCIASILAQNQEQTVEIVLVNNQSDTETMRAILQFVARSVGRAIFKIIDYDRPFNHSAQCNAGIEASTAEVVVLLNNDAELVSSNALSMLADWALVPGIGTVGCRIVSEKGELVCAGVKARASVGYEYQSSVEESRDVSFARVTRETFANTFACASIARRVYLAAGPLNAAEFPNGYNDVEYCMRLRTLGFRHIYLGHIVVRHDPGTSRGRCDEIEQKITLRRRFPQVAQLALSQLETDTHLLTRVKGAPHNAGRKISFMAILEALKEFGKRMVGVRGST